jgi:hypothetical protein
LRILDIDLGEILWRLIGKADDVCGDDASSQRHDYPSPDLCFDTLLRAQPVSESLKDMKWDCYFSVAHD